MLECENCGARLPAPRLDGSRKCEYCEAIHHPPAAPEPPPQMAAPSNLGGWSAVNVTVTTGSSPSSTYVRPSQSSSGCGKGIFVLAVIILAAVGIPLYFAFRSGSLSAAF